MPDADAPSKQELARIVSAYLTANEIWRDAHKAVLSTAEQQLRCRRAADNEAATRLSRALDAKAEAAQGIDESMEPVRDRWFAVYAFLPREARARADELLSKIDRLSLAAVAAQVQTARVQIAQTNPLDRPGVTCDCREEVIPVATA